MKTEDDPVITLAAEGIPLGLLLDEVSRQTDRNIVAATSVLTDPIAVRMTAVPLPEAVNVIARQAGVGVNRIGETTVVGPLRDDDRVTVVRHVPGRTADELEEAIAETLTGSGGIVAFDDGLIVLSDTASNLPAVTETVDKLAAHRTTPWSVQLVVVGSSATETEDLGIEVTPTASLTASAIATSGAANLVGTVTGGLDAVLRAVAESSAASVVADPLLMVTDGGESRYDRTARIPYVVSATTEAGVVVQTGIQTIDAGLRMTVSARTVAESRVRIGVRMEMTTAEDSDDGLPIVSGDRLDTTAELEEGRAYLIGSVTRRTADVARFRWLSLGRSSGERHETLQVYARAVRVGGRIEAERASAGPVFLSRSLPADEP
ncbi:MAG: hypothetical protein AAF532_09620 [Planctomycetota bacterium]